VLSQKWNELKPDLVSLKYEATDMVMTISSPSIKIFFPTCGNTPLKNYFAFFLSDEIVVAKLSEQCATMDFLSPLISRFGIFFLRYLSPFPLPLAKSYFVA